MPKNHRRFNLGICVFRILVDAAAFIIATLIFVYLLKSEDAASFYILLGYAVCVAVVVFDLYFVIRDIRFIREKEK